MASAVTIKDLARACGVSRQAVSNALRGDGRLGQETRHRIQRTAQQLGYRPNSIARTMRTGRFGNVALLTGTEARYHRFPRGLWEGVHDELAAHDQQFTMARVPENCLSTPDYLPKVFREWSVDGVLVNYTHNVSSVFTDAIKTHQIPAVWLNSQLTTDCVNPDDFDAGRMATDHLISLGHRRITYLNLSLHTGHHSEAHRQAGYEAAMRSAGLAPSTPDLSESERAVVAPTGERLALAHQFVKQSGRPTAVVTYSSWSGEPLLVAALAAGLRVPEDLAIVTIEDFPVESVGLPMTTVLLNVADMGRTAVRMVLRKIEDGHGPEKTILVPSMLVRGATS
jgi:LacI family transcriptional regulator